MAKPPPPPDDVRRALDDLARNVAGAARTPQPPEPPGVEAIIREAVAKALAAREAGEATPEVVQAPAVTLPAPGYTRVVTPDKRYERTAYVSDIHQPFHDPAAIKVTLAALRDYRPQLLILGGDQFDCYSISSHDKEPGRADCIQDEFDSARETWREFNDLGCDVIWLDGNHEERLLRLQAKNPGLFRLRALEIKRAAELPGRWMCYANQTRVKLGSLTCVHGDLKGRGTPGVHVAAGMLKRLRTSVLHGHLHKFQSHYETTAEGVYRAGFSNGHLCDVEAARYVHAPEWQSGFTTVDYDWSAGIFACTPHLIVRGKLRWGGTTYGG